MTAPVYRCKEHGEVEPIGDAIGDMDEAHLTMLIQVCPFCGEEVERGEKV